MYETKRQITVCRQSLHIMQTGKRGGGKGGLPAIDNDCGGIDCCNEEIPGIFINVIKVKDW